MITPEYCRTMARYNAWQNEGLRRVLTALPRAELDRDRGAFFGSVMATANHLLWADLIWMSRIDGGSRPDGGIADSVRVARNVADWEALRFRADGRIRVWADGLHALDLVGPLTWHSRSAGRDLSRPLALCVMHMFNHQTHHRGQIHAMLTQAGADLPETDLFLMPDAG